MITLQKLTWSNLFSYGENNVVDFSASPLTQIVGGNGHGKSSIALVLEEVLYNKNSKGIKKSDILNRNSKSKTYSIELDFEKDGDLYRVTTVRGTTQTVKLTKNSEDISSHTSTGTYKTLEEIIGYDHKTFSQIVYQSSASSLEFLTATDSNRKKFLIELLDLNRYVELGEVFKDEAKSVGEEVGKLGAQIKTVGEWIEKYKKADLEPRVVVEVPNLPKELIEANAEIRDKIKNIDYINKKIIQNNKYKEIFDSIVLEMPGVKPHAEVDQLKKQQAECDKGVRDAEAFIQKMNKLGQHCATCMQAIDQSVLQTILNEQGSIKSVNQARSKEIQNVLDHYNRELAEWNRKNKTVEEHERYFVLYNPTMDTTLLDKEELEAQIKSNEKIIGDTETKIKAATDHNNKVAAHNARIEVIKTELEENTQKLMEYQGLFDRHNERLGVLQILVKTFSSTGLVAYKIECLVKDLEELTNSYLNELSAGRFQLGFKVSSSDKLNVIITDHGKDIEITALSGGERARVNVSALLGIRKLMQSLSNTRINLLILDETIENLDLEGKEKLVEVLLREEYLNTFLISHGFSHPLLEKLTVVKKNNLSRIENG